MKVTILHTYGIGDAILYGSTIERVVENTERTKFFYTQKSVACVYERLNDLESKYINFFILVYRLIKTKGDETIVNTTTHSFWKFFLLFQLAYRARKIICTESGVYECGFLRYKTLFNVNTTHHRAYIFSVGLNFILHDTLEPILPLLPYFSYAEGETTHTKVSNLVVHLGSNSKYTSKRVSVHSFVALISALDNMHQFCNIILVEGPDERELTHEFVEKLPEVEIFRGSLQEVADLIRKTKLVISNDNGISHIAAAVSAAQIVLHSSNSHVDLRKTGQFNEKIMHVDEVEIQDDLQNLVNKIYTNLT